MLRLTPPVNAVTFPNSGFESFPTGGANDWEWPSKNWVWDGSITHSGTRSARVQRSSGGETASVYSAYIAVQPSTEYTLTYWLRTQNATWYPGVNVYQYTSSVIQTGPRLISPANVSGGTSGWTRITLRFQTMPDAAKIRVRLFLWTDTTGTFWFDDFALAQGSPAKYPFQKGFPVTASGSILFSSPAVADLDHDGDNELLIAGGSAVDGWDSTGIPLPGFPLVTGDNRIMGHLAIADLNQDKNFEIIAGTRTPTTDGQGRVFVWRHTGAIAAGWPKKVAWDTVYGNNHSWVSSVMAADITDDSIPEVVAGTTNNAVNHPGPSYPATPNLYAWQPNGVAVSGWPTWHTQVGIYGAIAAGDLTGDGKANVIVGRDHHYLNAYNPAGSSLPGWPVETYLNGNSGNYQTDYRMTYAYAAPIIADLDQNGSMEYIAAGIISGPGNITEISNSGLLVFNANGTRRIGWATPALGSAILDRVDFPRLSPVVADLNHDGQLEIIVNTLDGRLRAYDTNKNLLWAFDYTAGANLFAAEPAIGDIDGDGSVEIIFGTFVPQLWDGPVAVWAIEANGTVVAGFPLPVSPPGVRAAPTLADLDNDGDLEIIVGSRMGEVYAWDTPTSAKVWLPWPTGRHNLARTAEYTPEFFVRKYASPAAVKTDQTTTFTIEIWTNQPSTQPLQLSDTIPAGLTYVANSLTAGSGTASITGNTIQWNGQLSGNPIVTIRYQVRVIAENRQAIHNTATVNAGKYGLISYTGIVIVNGLPLYLPFIKK